MPRKATQPHEMKAYLESHLDVDESTWCWNWDGLCNHKGYGILGLKLAPEKFAHRLARHVFVGPIPAGDCVLHRCDNPKCCNPEHLFLGDRAANNRDMIQKGRRGRAGSITPITKCNYERGERHHSSKLNRATVLEIRKHRKSTGASYSSLAQKFGIQPGHAAKIVRRELWKHL